MEYTTTLAIEALDHPIVLRWSLWGQSMLNPQILSPHVKFMIPIGFSLTRGKVSIGEVFSVVG